MYPQFAQSSQQPSHGRKLTPKELIMKHILDPNHTVTDEELSEVYIGTDELNNPEASTSGDYTATDRDTK